MNERIIDFIRTQTNLTIATCLDQVPYCASCFYTFYEDEPSFVFKSRSGTRHITEALKNPLVAGTIVPDRLIKGKVRGLQFQGKFRAANREEAAAYYKKYTFAMAMPGDLWAIVPVEIKFTDNTLGFGTKINWSRTTSLLS